MRLNSKFLQRALLAFTTGIFLACAARLSATTDDSSGPAVYQSTP
ncbi:MAG TPA: hypothetical protein VF785_07210 [Gemmatimonadaceae bacterium]